MKHDPATMVRRSFLRGSGVSLALPLLHGLSRNAWAQTGATYPRRLVLWWVPEGVVPDKWWPTPRTGPGLSTSLAPLAPYRDRLSIIHGLNMHPEAERSNDGSDDHIDCPGAVLTGGRLGPDRTLGGVTIPGGRSVDRVLGPAIQGNALLPSYVIGANNFHSNSNQHRQVSFDRLRRGYDGVSNPQVAFDALLANVGPRPAGVDLAADPARVARLRNFARRKSVLDSLVAELNRLRCQVGTLERGRLDAHLESVRTVERQIEALRRDTEAPAPTAAALNVPRVSVPAEAASAAFYTAHQNFPQVIELQSRILASAIAAGTTRVAVMALGPGGFSPQTYPFAPLNITKWHHDLSHNLGEWGNLARVNLWYEERLAFFLGLLAAMPEGQGSVLDHTLVVRFSEIADGNHAKRNLPFLIAGMGDKFRLGKNFDAGGRAHNDLLTAILQGFGLDITRLGPEAANAGPYSDVLM